MDKAHILMVNGYPATMEWSPGNAGDHQFAAGLIRRITGKTEFYEKDRIYADGAYDTFNFYAEIYLATRRLLRAAHRFDSSYNPEINDEYLKKEFNKLRKKQGYNHELKYDFDKMIRFMCLNGRKREVGIYLRNKDLALYEEEQKNGVRDTSRSVCETVHMAKKL